MTIVTVWKLLCCLFEVYAIEWVEGIKFHVAGIDHKQSDKIGYVVSLGDLGGNRDCVSRDNSSPFLAG